MKRIIFILIVAALAGCGRGQDKVAALKANLRTGDLVFAGIPADYSLDDDSMGSAISDATGKGDLNLVHVAIAEVGNDTIWIIDATIKHGVDRHPLDTMLKDFTLKDGSLPVFIVKRLKDDSAAFLCKKHVGYRVIAFIREYLLKICFLITKTFFQYSDTAVLTGKCQS